MVGLISKVRLMGVRDEVFFVYRIKGKDLDLLFNLKNKIKIRFGKE